MMNHKIVENVFPFQPFKPCAMNLRVSLTLSVLGVLTCSGLAQAYPVGHVSGSLLSQGLGAETSLSESSIPYQTYINDTFNFRVQVPENMFTSAAPMVGKMGQRFLSSSGNFEMAVYGQNQGNWTLEQLYENTLFVYRQQGAEITFSELGSDQFIISAIDPEGAVLYTKKIFHEDNLLTLGLFYDAALQLELEPVVDDIADSFRPVD